MQPRQPTIRNKTESDAAKSPQRYAIRPDERVSEAVVRAVSTATATELQLDDPLYDHIDPDALNDLFRPYPGRQHSGTEVHFNYHSYTVVVTADAVELR
ncbi:HalOD1 output domain-containing protein [Haladaptatus pallidirubidus]|uniref:Halobacterial output domain-containing protein n=1 Tax=Haladaptatus pallidirubidus TaxID=1008152 RepID=A0AAV3UKQ6_9EURY|nr:HalOD1 output domain-containing protein [Haladaptatus pallidirubidus]